MGFLSQWLALSSRRVQNTKDLFEVGKGGQNVDVGKYLCLLVLWHGLLIDLTLSRLIADTV
jgi:hypothetical protein